MGQGPITLHFEEHLTGSDKEVIMQRRLLARVQAGNDFVE
jgi:hypothetical protein